jgi:xanthine dehydrogenase accessory factor
MNAQVRYYDRLGELLRKGSPFVSVTVIDSHGSTPADTGSRMLVTAAGLEFGTVGGGRIEAKAIQEAQCLLAGNLSHLYCDWSLKADVGMTCGGRVKLFFERWNATPWTVVIFGAGHVTQALVRTLETLACQITCIDPRCDWIEKLPVSVNGIVHDDPASQVDALSSDAFVLCMTKGHQSDFPVLRRIFELGRVFPYLGVIGSRAKAAVLRKELMEVGLPADGLCFHCPVGLMNGESPLGSNDPAEIAISIAAQLLQERDRWLQATTS